MKTFLLVIGILVMACGAQVEGPTAGGEAEGGSAAGGAGGGGDGGGSSEGSGGADGGAGGGGSDLSCELTATCKITGRCTTLALYEAQECPIPIPCEAPALCENMQPSPLEPVVAVCCTATSDEDCAASDECMSLGRCTLGAAGFCE